MNDPEQVTKLIIHAVHGTWPYGLWAHLLKKQQDTKSTAVWFLSGSSFHQALISQMGEVLEWVPFEWSGKNSFAARALAAKALSEHLTQSFQRKPTAEHVIIAHSHGGSVAVAAARILDANNHNCLTKIISLASPFAQRRPRDKNNSELLADYLTLRFGWINLLLFGLFMLWANFRGVEYDPLPIWVGVLFFGFLMIIFVLPAYFILWKIGVLRFKSPDQSGAMFFKRLAPKWTLYAIRAPGDEATIAISTSQFILFVFDLFFVKLLVIPFEWCYNQAFGATVATDIKRNVWIICGIIVGVALFLWAGLRVASLGNSFFIALELFVWSPFVFLTLIMLVGPLILIPANAILALALGLDVMRDRGLTTIECEPVPSGITGIVSTIKISEEDRSRLGLVHFIHATDAARSRVAEILKESRIKSLPPEETPAAH